MNRICIHTMYLAFLAFGVSFLNQSLTIIVHLFVEELWSLLFPYFLVFFSNILTVAPKHIYSIIIWLCFVYFVWVRRANHSMIVLLVKQTWHSSHFSLTFNDYVFSARNFYLLHYLNAPFTFSLDCISFSYDDKQWMHYSVEL